MRISDWSSDVCSSDLHRGAAVAIGGVCAQQMKRMRRVLAVDRMAFRFGGGVHGSSFRVEGIKSAGDEVAYRFRITAFVIWHNAMAARGAMMARSEEHTSELQSLIRISYAVFCLKKHTTEHEERIYRNHCDTLQHDTTHAVTPR